MNTSTLTETPKFDDIRKILLNEELLHKSIAKNYEGEYLAIGDYGRKIEPNR